MAIPVEPSQPSESQPSEKKWKPIGRNMRRVFGVLIEKAKTTPDSYPLTISSLISGCKQKSNRDPLMDLDEDEVVEALDQLRNLGAVREVQGSGRVNKYRHCAYEWLDVTASQAAIMTELLLRGPQTMGELRARASRMEAFDSLEMVKTVLTELQAKGLVEPLSSPGRGQTFGHSLYELHERAKVLNKVATSGTPDGPDASSSLKTTRESPRSDQSSESLTTLLEEVRELRQRVERLETELGISQ